MGSLPENFYPGTKEPLNSTDVIARIRKETDTIMVAFSTGKDSIATYLRVKDEFPRVELFFRYFIPDLEFMERRVQYYEETFNVKIHRVPSPHLYRMLRNFLWQPPHRVGLIDSMEIPPLTYEQINAMLVEHLQMPDNTFTAVGVRAIDNMQRRAVCKSRGAINWNDHSFWPVWDFSHDDVATIIRRHNVKLLPEYVHWGTSFDGLRYFFLNVIRREYPRDYERIIEWFPYAEMEFMRRNLAGGTIETET
jgi:3'-phosphoadenosine 5'-phosphosulfate sulfotransferase (PAPS reductase)/FAD synthetase